MQFSKGIRSIVIVAITSLFLVGLSSCSSSKKTGCPGKITQIEIAEIQVA